MLNNVMDYYANALAAYTPQVAEGWTLVGRIVDTDGEDWGYVAVKPTENRIMVAIPGTRTPEQWVEDFLCLVASGQIIVTTGIHAGFNHIFTMFREQFLQLMTLAISQMTGPYTIQFTGHSLGAALTTRAAWEMSAQIKALNLCATIEGCTWAGPRLFVPTLSHDFEDVIKSWYRVENWLDPVPTAPPPPLFEAVGNQIHVWGGFVYDVRQAHNLAHSYLPGITHWMEKQAKVGSKR